MGQLLAISAQEEEEEVQVELVARAVTRATPLVVSQQFKAQVRVTDSAVAVAEVVTLWKLAMLNMEVVQVRKVTVQLETPYMAPGAAAEEAEVLVRLVDLGGNTEVIVVMLGMAVHRVVALVVLELIELTVLVTEEVVAVVVVGLEVLEACQVAAAVAEAQVVVGVLQATTAPAAR